MHINELCADCHWLLQRQGGTAHPYLIPRSRITDHVIYRCRRCRGLLEHQATTQGWTRLPIPWPGQALDHPAPPQGGRPHLKPIAE